MNKYSNDLIKYLFNHTFSGLNKIDLDNYVYEIAVDNSSESFNVFDGKTHMPLFDINFFYEDYSISLNNNKRILLFECKNKFDSRFLRINDS